MAGNGIKTLLAASTIVGGLIQVFQVQMIHAQDYLKILQTLSLNIKN